MICTCRHVINYTHTHTEQCKPKKQMSISKNNKKKVVSHFSFFLLKNKYTNTPNEEIVANYFNF